MAESEHPGWLTTEAAAHAIGCSSRTVERLAAAGKLEQRLRRQEGTPPVAVFSPESVAEEAARRRRTPAPFVVGAIPAVNGNHKGPAIAATRNLDKFNPAGDDPIRQLAALVLALLSSPPSPPALPPLAERVTETLYVTVKEAAAILGLPQVDVRALIQDGDLNHRVTSRGGIRIRRKDLEAL